MTPNLYQGTIYNVTASTNTYWYGDTSYTITCTGYTCFVPPKTFAERAGWINPVKIGDVCASKSRVVMVVARSRL